MSELEEDRAIDQVIARLAERFPTISHAHIGQVVYEEQHRLDENPVRDFVPVLVEHAASDRLRDEAEPVSVEPDAAAESGGVADEPNDFADEPVELDPMEIERLKSRKAGFLFGDLGGGPV